VPAWDLAELVRQARARRADVKVARAMEDAAEARRVAAKREWLIPSFSVGLLYFPPTGAATEHGYGVSLAVELPWLWGGGKNRTDGAARAKDAAVLETRGKNVSVDTEVAEADAEARTQALRLRILEDQVLPATRRALDVSLAGYEASKGDLVMLLVARRSVVDTELQITLARAALDHALVDLDAAVGAEVPRVPLRSARMP
jgi:outer membrane protein TolC